MLKTSFERERAISLCVELCKNFKGDKSRGPCLANETISDWVCDVAHDPRLPVDDEEENQCPAYGVTAFHFVEVSEDCDLIRAV